MQETQREVRTYGNYNRMIEEIKSSRRAEGTQELFLPGEIEFRVEEERKASGIPVGAETVSELREAAGVVASI